MTKRSNHLERETIFLYKPLDDVVKRATRYGFSPMFGYHPDVKMLQEQFRYALEIQDMAGMMSAAGILMNYMAYEIAKRDLEIDRMKFGKKKR